MTASLKNKHCSGCNKRLTTAEKELLGTVCVKCDKMRYNAFSDEIEVLK